MIVVNFSTPEYLRGQKRLKESVAPTPFMGFSSYSEIGSPSHQASPYEFKIHSIRKAAQVDPVVLWADSSIKRVGDLNIVKDIIERDGYFMEEAGHYVKDWCNPQAASYFGINKDCDYLMFSAGLTGLNFNNPLAVEFFEQWAKSARDGMFKGNWKNHRHDMTCGSIIATRLGMKYQRGGTHLAYIGAGYSTPNPNVVFHCQGL